MVRKKLINIRANSSDLFFIDKIDKRKTNKNFIFRTTDENHSNLKKLASKNNTTMTKIFNEILEKKLKSTGVLK